MNPSLDEAGWTPESAQSALKKILSRAAADAAFRELCLSDARAAVLEEIQCELPKDFTLRFVDNARADLTVVLPDAPASAELSDQDLEAVSGGIKCLVGSCGATEMCGITDPCLVTKGGDDHSGKEKQKV